MDLNYPHQQATLFEPFKVIEQEEVTETINDKVYIGIDPGADGAIVILQGDQIIEKHLVPKRKELSKKASKHGKGPDKGKNKKDKNGRLIYNMREVIDEVAFGNLIRDLKDFYPESTVILESVRNIQGTSSASNFAFGYNFGFLKGILTAARFDIHLVTPREWQKEVIIDSDKRLTESMDNDPKHTSLVALKRIFPDVDLKATARSTTFHNGLVDANLVAHYGQLKNL